MSKKLVLGVSQTLKTLRNANQISQEELAEKANLDRTYISGVERGVRNITLSSLEAIVDGLDIDLLDFLDSLKNHIQSEQTLNQHNSDK
ncbi:helix-turn-helix domain-containing protein [Shewanella sp. KT0246]|uniref:helix-turn-helix domain-containing protein n=1 Tax=Shewanella sp. KT0246 TaxID=2815912 RepID=UPI001BC44402|nr:helix-turn-helix transcriptional regulator [Shewanella sp. KT0246]GIU51819.1 transcriptional regulator [Shewanella sp. KT0246]